ncbi:hypothetical protein V8E55_008003 [Tylopilus felleus]
MSTGNNHKNLPSNLSLNPIETSYHFGLDSKHVEDEGVWYALNRNLEERGDQYKTLIKMIKVTLKMLPNKEHTFLCDVWLECLICTAELQGAKVLPKRKHTVKTMGENVQPIKHAHTSNKETIELSESDTAPDSEDEVAPAEQQSSQKNISIPPNKAIQQLTFHDLSCKPLKTEDEWLEQKKQLKQMDEKMWGGLDEEQEHRRAQNLKKIHQHQLATQ